MTPLGQKAVELAKQSLGVKEDPKGSNSGPEVTRYLANVNIHTPAPWCAAFVYTMIRDAAKVLTLKSFKWPQSGYVQAVVNWAKANKLTTSAPSVGCCFAVFEPELKRYAHIGFVSQIQGNKFLTIEGNSNTDGSREGYEVASNWRVNNPARYLFITIE